MSGLGYTMVNGPGRAVTVMLNGTEAEYKAPRTKAVPDVRYSVNDPVEEQEKEAATARRGRGSRSRLSSRGGSSSAGNRRNSHGGGKQGGKKGKAKGGWGTKKSLLPKTVTFVPALTTAIALPPDVGSPSKTKADNDGAGSGGDHAGEGKDGKESAATDGVKRLKRRPGKPGSPKKSPGGGGGGNTTAMNNQRSQASPMRQRPLSARSTRSSGEHSTHFGGTGTMHSTQRGAPMQTTRTRRNPKDRIPRPRQAWNASTSYNQPVSLLWELNVARTAGGAVRYTGGSGAENKNAHVPRGKRFASAHITRSARPSLHASPQPPEQRVRASGRSTGRPQTSFGLHGGGGGRAGSGGGRTTGETRQRPRSAMPRRSGTALNRANCAQRGVTIPQPFHFALSSRLGGRRAYAVTYNVYNPSEACAVMYDFPDVPRRNTEAGVGRLLPYANYRQPGKRRRGSTGGRIVRHGPSHGVGVEVGQNRRHTAATSKPARPTSAKHQQRVVQPDGHGGVSSSSRGVVPGPVRLVGGDEA